MAGLFGVVPLVLGVSAGITCPWLALEELPNAVADGVANLSILLVPATVVWAYRWRRFQIAKKKLCCERGEKRRKVCYAKYADYPCDADDG